jgi:hypothetical protein
LRTPKELKLPPYAILGLEGIWIIVLGNFYQLASRKMLATTAATIEGSETGFMRQYAIVKG